MGDATDLQELVDVLEALICLSIVDQILGERTRHAGQEQQRIFGHVVDFDGVVVLLGDLGGDFQSGQRVPMRQGLQAGKRDRQAAVRRAHSLDGLFVYLQRNR